VKTCRLLFANAQVYQDGQGRERKKTSPGILMPGLVVTR